MRLKKLEVHGFKSFADRTVLLFHQGITAIVGPNGCGKSNISDAFRWVLGEQSAKSMRGGKMHDVIFAGTNSRKPLNFAEVSITLTDVGDALPIEYQEVTITRRLHRSGESDYLINRHPVRLRDIQSMLLDSGIGKNAFAIFEQGKIDEVINKTPRDRRRIFEEAAAILRFLQSKDQMMRRLDQVDLNLEKAWPLYESLQKTIAELEKQAQRAMQYKDNMQRFEQLEKAVMSAKYQRLFERQTQYRQKEAEVQTALDDHHGLLRLLDRQAIHTKEELALKEKAFRERSEQVYQARSKREIESKERLSQQQRMQEAAEKEKKYQADVRELQKKRESQRLDFEHGKRRHQEVEKDLLIQEESLQIAKKQFRKSEALVGDLRRHQLEAQQERFQLTRDSSQAEAELKENRVRLENSEERLEALQSKRAESKKKVTELRAQSEEKGKAVKEVSEQVDKQRALLASVEETLEQLEGDLKQASADRELLMGELTEIRARQKVLLKLKEDMEGFSKGTRILLNESQDPKSSIHKKVYPLHELLRPEEGYETALATVMKPYMQTLVVETQKDFDSVLRLAEKQDLNDFSLLCMEHLPPSEGSPAGVEKLLEHVSGALADHFLGRVAVVDGATEALEKMKVEGLSSVTQDGILVDRQGVLFFTNQGESNTFLREAELKKLAERLSEVEAALQTLIQRNEALQGKKAHGVQERMTLDQKVRTSEMKLVEVNFAFQQVKTDLVQWEKESSVVEEEGLRLEKLSKSLREVIATLEKRHHELHVRAEERHAELARVEKQLDGALKEFDQLRAELQEVEQLYKKAHDEHQNLSHTLKVHGVKEEESFQHEERLLEEIKGLRKTQEDLREKQQTVQQNLGDVEKALSGVEAEALALEQDVESLKGRMEHVSRNQAAVRHTQHEQEEAKHQLGVKVAQLDSQMDALESEIRERHHMSMEEALALNLTLETSLDEAEKEVRRLRREVEKKDDVNMTAIEAVDEHKKEYQRLHDQIQDLQKSKEELLSIVGDLDNESRKKFTETFEVIRANFKKNFAILFNGGEADLTFAEGEDVLQAGIEIIAKPPGKKMRSISLLSGGEKCMTAMALLFAIFEVKPAPFCILDEIDAPLDDSNIQRFVNVVQQFIERSQFVIITHNKRTMAIADKIFGVSMEERGVSKLLTMQFDHSEEESEDVEERELVTADCQA